MASVIQASLACPTATASTAFAPQIQQHREWMTRSYPFAMVFVVVVSSPPIPAVAAAGPLGLSTTVWSVIATRVFPAFVCDRIGRRCRSRKTEGHRLRLSRYTEDVTGMLKVPLIGRMQEPRAESLPSSPASAPPAPAAHSFSVQKTLAPGRQPLQHRLVLALSFG